MMLWDVPGTVSYYSEILSWEMGIPSEGLLP